MNALMSVKRAGRMYGENRFLNVSFAAEAFHRDTSSATSLPHSEFDEVRTTCLEAVGEGHREWLDQRLRFANEPTFRNRLRSMVDEMGQHALPFVENLNRWVSVVVGVRNALTHLDSRETGFEGGDLYYLSESVFSLVRACMLGRLGIAGRAIVGKTASQPFSWYADRLNSSVEQLRRLV
jgi:hypothetical protein